MSKTIITTDSPADVPAELRERYGIHVIPLHITLDDKSYEDGVNITPDDLYAFYREKGRLPKTAAVSIPEYMDFFGALTADGSAVVHVAFTSKLSVPYHNACLAAAPFENVYFLDAQSPPPGITPFVIQAC